MRIREILCVRAALPLPCPADARAGLNATAVDMATKPTVTTPDGEIDWP